ncbi:MAG: hypothetical protein GXO83_08550 [Chlorobi bacterium]|nr:hypothetical protein [Chlorobiota bacterium]
MKSVFFKYITSIIISFAAATSGGVIAQKSHTGTSAKDSTWLPSPRKAALYAATFPGLGQIYTKNYWKVPVVYAGFVTVGYFIWFNISHYETYKNAYLDFTDVDPETASYLTLVGPGLDPASFDHVLYPESQTYTDANRDWFKNQLKNGLDYYRRYRDLSVIGTAGWYMITILDAVVDAQLFDYDISEDLGFQFLPVARPVYGQGVLGVTCIFQF